VLENFFPAAPQISRLYATAAATVATKPAHLSTTQTAAPVQHLRSKINENVCVIILDTPGSKVRCRLVDLFTMVKM
jgi:tRNA A37 threonylcarbamoyladenosine synthetase subunit TsaC/SUA5/YrdC